MFGWRRRAERADALERERAALRDAVAALTARLAAVEARCDAALPRIDRLGGLDARLGELDARLERQDAALDEGRMAALRVDRALAAQAEELGKVGTALFERIEALRRTP